MNSADAFRQSIYDRRREIRIAVTVLPDVLDIKVSDNAGGIPDELLPRIFEPFVTTKSQGHGTGLGLAFVSGHIRAWGGSISVHNDERGAVFEIVLRRSSSRHEREGERPEFEPETV